jgi:hypothetical protein
VDPSVVNAALSCLAYGQSCGSYRPAALYPTIRGAMTWSINWDAANGYRWSNSVGAHLTTLPGGTGGPPPTTPPTTAPPTTTAPPAACGDLAPWDRTAVYWGGARVSFEGHRWTAKWWTQGDVPGRNGQDVWRDDGAC